MRSLLVVVLVLAAVGGAAWLLFRPPESAEPTETGPLATREGGGKPSDESGLRAEAPRVGVVSPRDRDLVAASDPNAWHSQMLRFSAAPGARLTGLDLLDAVGKHLYVRAKDLATLDALRKQDLGMDVPPEMPLSAAVPLLERAGYAVQVQPPLFSFRRLAPAEQETRTPPPAEVTPPR